MSYTYLNGKITVSSLAAPTEEDKKAFFALTPEEQSAVLQESLQQADDSPVVETAMDEIWQNALSRYKARHAVSSH